MSKNSSYKTEIYGLGRLAFKGQIYTLEYSKKNVRICNCLEAILNCNHFP